MKCPAEGRKAKRLLEAEPGKSKELIGTEALKLMEEVLVGGEKAANAREELASIERSIEQAQKYGWEGILELQIKKRTVLKQSLGTELDNAKGARTVIGAQVNLVHTHESKCSALEAAIRESEAALTKHKERAEERVQKEKERHEAALKAIGEDCRRFTKHEEEVSRTKGEELVKQKEEYQKVNNKITGYISRHLPVEPEPLITPEMFDHEEITRQIQGDEALKGLDLTGEMGQTLCKLMNILASSKSKKAEAAESEAEDEKEEPDEEEARAEWRQQRAWRRTRKSNDEVMPENSRYEVGKKEAEGGVDAEQGKKARATEDTEEQKAAKVIDLARKAQEQMAAKEAALKAAEETTKNAANPKKA